MTELAGQLLAARFEILGELGRGSSSVVYDARDIELGSRVAVKLLVPPPAQAAQALERLRREVRAIRALSHPSIVPVFDLIEEPSRAFVVMERVDGPTLEQRVKNDGPLKSQEVAAIGIAIAEALSAAHRAGILHRDVKPQNILIGPDQRARLVDFGSAKLDGESALTRSGSFVGTLDYAAPEALAGEPIDGRSDLYGLCLSLYFALTGRLPERGSPHLPPDAKENGHRPSAFGPVDSWLDDLIRRGTAREPRQRPPTAERLARALRDREGGSALAPLPGPGRPFCFFCGQEAAEFGVACARCARATAGSSNSLLFLEPGDYAPTLSELTGRSPAELLPVLRGRRPLVGLEGARADEVKRRLGALGVTALEIRRADLYRRLPTSFVLMLLVVATTGLFASSLGLTMLGWSGPLLALILLGVGLIDTGRPLLLPKRVPSPLPELTEHVLARELAALPDRSLAEVLSDLAELSRAAVRASPNDREAIVTLVETAAAEMQPLAELERAKKILGKHPSPATRAAEARAEQARDRALQHLLESMAILADLAQKPGGAAGARLVELKEALAQDLELRREAQQEVDALLG